MKQKTSPLQKALNLWAIILIVWSFYRAKMRLPEWFDEFIAKPLVFIAPVAYYILKIEKKAFFQGLDWKLKSPFKNYLIGFGIGMIFFFTAILANFLKYKGFNFFSKINLSAVQILLIIITALATSLSEEILSRGFILKRLYEESKNVISSSFFASILFFFIHVPILFTNLKLTGNLLLYFMMTDLILSLTISIIYLGTKDLTPSILIHAFYNISIYFFT